MDVDSHTSQPYLHAFTPWARACLIGLAAVTLGCAPESDKAHPQRVQQDTEESSPDVPAEHEEEETQREEEPPLEEEEEEVTPPVDEDAAEIIAMVLPTGLDCGATYAAAVEVRNTGSATWSRAAGYKLGAVGDHDDFYTADTRVWMPEGVEVAPGQSITFEFQLLAPVGEGTYNTDWQMVHEGVQWFGDITDQAVVVACSEHTFCDPLTDASLRSGYAEKDIDGGSFTAAGWQTTDDGDQIRLAMDTPIYGSGRLEVDVTNFDPYTQYRSTKHQIINMYTSDNGSQDVFETDEAWWNIRTGSNYGTGLKYLAAPIGGDSREETRLIADASWDPSHVHTFAVEWDATEVHLYLNGDLLETLAFDGRTQPLQYVFLGRDNVYVGQIGPIYSNLCVTQ